MPKKYRKIEKRLYITFKHQIVWLISTAFGIAAALMWRDTMLEIFRKYMPAQTLSYSIYASIIFTLIAILVIWILNVIFKQK